MGKAIGLYFGAVEAITFVGTVIIYAFQLPFKNKTEVFANFIETITKNHVSSIGGAATILGKWTSSFNTRHIPMIETFQYLWDYKIGIVGIVVLILFGLYTYWENNYGR